MARQRVHKLLIEVTAPVAVSQSAVRRVVNKLLDIGLADAQSSVDLDGPEEDACLAVEFDITKPTTLECAKAATGRSAPQNPS